jgi:hypothetical protein
MEISRTKKRIVVIAIYLLIFAIIVLGIYLMIKPDPSCSDGKMNQNEKDTDCGGVCRPCEEKNGKDLVVLEKAVVDGGSGTYDVAVKVNNPNNRVGSPEFNYSFVVNDNSGQTVYKKTGKSYILPAETKYIVEMGIQLPQGVTSSNVSVIFEGVTWKTLAELSKPELNIYSKDVTVQQNGSGVVAQALLRNESSYDFAKIKIAAVLRNGSGSIIGINSTEKETVKAGEERDFKFVWPYSLGSDVASFDVEATTDLYDEKNFLKSKYKPQEFQR